MQFENLTLYLGTTGIVVRLAFLGLSVIAIWLGIHFYRRHGKQSENVSISLEAINTHTNVLQRMLMKTEPENPARELYRQLVADLDRQCKLIKRHAAGDRSVKQEIDKLQGAIKVKSLVARAARRESKEK